MSVQIARTAGARVAATVSAGPKAELAAKLGAERCIDYRSEDVGEAVRAWFGGDGADVVHDTVGGRTFADSFGLVRPYGDLVSNVESPWPEAAVEAMQQRNLRVSFTWMPAPSVSAGSPSGSGRPGSWRRRRGCSTRGAVGAGRGDLPPRGGGRGPSRARGRPGARQGRAGRLTAAAAAVSFRAAWPAARRRRAWSGAGRAGSRRRACRRRTSSDGGGR
jgi:hypothetical protein